MKSFFSLLVLLSFYGAGHCQIVDRKAEEAKNKANQRVENKSSETIDKGLDKIEKGIGNIFKKKKKKGKEDAPAENKVTNPVISSKDTGDVPDFAVYKGSAFVPGKNVLFFEDFLNARLGAGLSNWYLYEYDSHTDAERPVIRSIAGTKGNWLKMPRKGFVFPNSFKNLPEQFTIEFDLYADPATMSEMEGGFRANFIASNDREQYNMYWPAEPAIGLDVHPHGSTRTVNVSATTEYKPSGYREDMVLFEKTFATGWNPGEVNHVSISRNAGHIQLYLNGTELINLPNGLPKKGQYTLILSANLWGDGMLVSNIRVAADVLNAAKEIKAEGRFVTNAIYFDVNSSRIRPESWAALQQAADAIKAITGSVLIIGHTDSDGSDEANISLSKKRAEAVKSALKSEFGIDAGRLQTDGKGESQPVENNNTASGKAQNRRVEFVKQ